VHRAFLYGTNRNIQFIRQMILLRLEPKNVHLTVSLNSESVLNVEIRIFKIKMSFHNYIYLWLLFLLVSGGTIFDE